jgi:AbrB family looped-hinge helix DNA binding protein
MPTVTVSSKGWVVIPADYRKRYQVYPGSRVEIVDYGGGMSLVPVLARPLRDAQGLLRGRRPVLSKAEGSLTGALLQERAKERKREAAR